MKTLVSIIIPVRKINDYIHKEVIPSLKGQSFKNFELIIIPDKEEKKEKLPSFVRVIPSYPLTGPADKRDLGAKAAKGAILAFIDDDAYPCKNWLKNAISYFKNPKIAAVCGPGITPTRDNLRQQVSGLVWATWLGAGGNTFRCSQGKKRAIDDYPTFNLIIRKKDFVKVGGFDSKFWPGEDTALCYSLVYTLKKKIIYDPKILVFHHRRPVFIPHLRQIARFGLHRGFFAKILPKTSKRLAYFIPLLFVIWLFLTPILVFLLEILQLCVLAIPLFLLYLFSFFTYLFLLLATAVYVFLKERNLVLALLLVPAIISTHLVYGIMFARGLLAKELKQ